MKITLLTLPPSGNVFKRMHWAAVRDLRARFAWSFRMEAELCGKRPSLPQYLGKVRLGIRVYRKGRRYDEDGFIGGLKPMIDGMRDAGYLRNDSPVWLELEPRPEQVKCGADEERVEIEYTEITSQPARVEDRRRR